MTLDPALRCTAISSLLPPHFDRFPNASGVAILSLGRNNIQVRFPGSCGSWLARRMFKFSKSGYLWIQCKPLWIARTPIAANLVGGWPVFSKALRMRIIGTLIGLSALGIPRADASLTTATAGAVGCRDSRCNGLSAVSMGCDRDAVSLNSVVFEDHASGGTFGRQVVTLRYSPRCRASWSRVTATAGGTAAVTKNAAFINRYSSSTKRTAAGPGTVVSRMRSGKVRACGTTNFNGNAVIETHCVIAR